MAAERQLSEADFQREGLLEDLDANEREARLDLLRQLAERGVGLDELKRAVEQDRLALLPIELVLRDQRNYTFREYAEMSGLGERFCGATFSRSGSRSPNLMTVSSPSAASKLGASSTA
jgi:hypothetical protein